MLNEVSFEGRRFTSLIPSKCEVKSPYPWISIQPRIRPHTPWHGISMRVYAGEFPRILFAGNPVSEKNSSRKPDEQARLPTPRYPISMRVYVGEFPRMSLLGFSVNKSVVVAFGRHYEHHGRGEWSRSHQAQGPQLHWRSSWYNLCMLTQCAAHKLT
jgi:hypothetical protein